MFITIRTEFYCSNFLKAEIRKTQVIFVNCMALKQPQDIFKKIAVELVGEDKCPAKATQKFLEEEFSTSNLTRCVKRFYLYMTSPKFFCNHSQKIKRY